MDPVSFMEKEVQQLVDAGVAYHETLFVGNVHIVTPYHKLLDFLQSATNASTLKGMSPVHASKVTKRGIRLDHLFNDREVCRRRLAKDMEAYTTLLKAKDLTAEDLYRQCEAMNADGNIRMPPHVLNFVKAADPVQFLLDLYDQVVVHNPAFPERRDVTFAIRDALEKGQKVLLEGPQSYWLSNASEKFWESSTSADTSAHGLVATARFNLQKYKSLVVNIHKAPGSSRVGIGASPSSYVAQDYFSRQNITTLQDLPQGACTDFDAIQKAFHSSIGPNGIVRPNIFVDHGKEYLVSEAMAIGSAIHHGECGATTKKPRVVGFFDCVAHFEVNQTQGPYLSVSALDRADDYNKVGLTIAYVYYHPQGLESKSNGRVYRNHDIIKAGDPLPTEQILFHCHPIVLLCDGWKESPINAAKRQPGTPLPKGCQDFIGAIEHFTGAEVISIGNGPNADNFIYIQRASASPAVPSSAPKQVTADFANGDREKDLAVYEGIKDIPPIPELSWKNTKRYQEVPSLERLHPLIDSHDVIMIVGAYFGDEGKGKTVDDVCRNPKIGLVVRVNSGENAGHTVFHGGRKFVFNLAPSGLLKGKVNMVGPECVMDPVSFMEKEVQQLVDAGVAYRDTLFVGNVHVVTPYHKLLDFMQSATNASTLKGMSPAHSSKVTKRGIRLDHLFNDREVCRRRLAKDMEAYTTLLKAKNLTAEDLYRQCKAMNADGNIRMPIHVLDFIKAQDQVQYLVDLYDKWVVANPAFPDRRDVTFAIRDALQKGQKVLLEGPQSYWLSNASEKFWESSTSADTSAHGLLATARFNMQRYKSLVINIHKAPGSSRVGIGASPSSYVAQDYFSRQNITTLQDLPQGACTNFDTIQRAFHDSIQPNGVVKPTVFVDNGVEYGVGVAMAISSALHHGECGATTKKPRVVGFFDCVAHFEVNQTQGPYLSISALDRADDYDKVGLTIAYIYYHPRGLESKSNGRVYRNLDVIKAGDPLPTEQILYHCHPIVLLCDGWKGSPINVDKRQAGAPLPQGCQDFIGAVERFTGAEVISIGNGPNADNFIYLAAE
eukprot:GGOE01024363.1.p1 GENE.GGOE01024363.1~~GGOE01024363.1.p1  ORF type:complete len:1185 (+),score=397.63 GGOE01024363.1:384-3557(+)